MPSRPRDKRRVSVAQVIYALTVIVTIPPVMLIEVGRSHMARSTRRPPAFEFGPDFRPMSPYGPNMDVPARIVLPLDIKPLKR